MRFTGIVYYPDSRVIRPVLRLVISRAGKSQELSSAVTAWITPRDLRQGSRKVLSDFEGYRAVQDVEELVVAWASLNNNRRRGVGGWQVNAIGINLGKHASGGVLRLCVCGSE